MASSSGSLTSPSPSLSPPPVSKTMPTSIPAVTAMKLVSNSVSSANPNVLDDESELSELSDDTSDEVEEDSDPKKLRRNVDGRRRIGRKRKKTSLLPGPMWGWAYKNKDEQVTRPAPDKEEANESKEEAQNNVDEKNPTEVEEPDAEEYEEEDANDEPNDDDGGHGTDNENEEDEDEEEGEEEEQEDEEGVSPPPERDHVPPQNTVSKSEDSPSPLLVNALAPLVEEDPVPDTEAVAEPEPDNAPDGDADENEPVPENEPAGEGSNDLEVDADPDAEVSREMGIDQDQIADVEPDQDQDQEMELDPSEEHDLNSAMRVEALDALSAIEIKFALLRERLYIDKMADLLGEEELVLSGMHPELAHLQNELEKRRDRRCELAGRKRKREDESCKLRRRHAEKAIWDWWKFERDRLQNTMISETSRKRRRLERDKRIIERPQPQQFIPPPNPPLPPSKPSLKEILKVFPFPGSKQERDQRFLPSVMEPVLPKLSAQEVAHELEYFAHARRMAAHPAGYHPSHSGVPQNYGTRPVYGHGGIIAEDAYGGHQHGAPQTEFYPPPPPPYSLHGHGHSGYGQPAPVQMSHAHNQNRHGHGHPSHAPVHQQSQPAPPLTHSHISTHALPPPPLPTTAVPYTRAPLPPPPPQMALPPPPAGYSQGPIGTGRRSPSPGPPWIKQQQPTWAISGIVSSGSGSIKRRHEDGRETDFERSERKEREREHHRSRYRDPDRERERMIHAQTAMNPSQSHLHAHAHRSHSHPSHSHPHSHHRHLPSSTSLSGNPVGSAAPLPPQAHPQHHHHHVHHHHHHSANTPANSVSNPAPPPAPETSPQFPKFSLTWKEDRHVYPMDERRLGAPMTPPMAHSHIMHPHQPHDRILAAPFTVQESGRDSRREHDLDRDRERERDRDRDREHWDDPPPRWQNGGSPSLPPPPRQNHSHSHPVSHQSTTHHHRPSSRLSPPPRRIPPSPPVTLPPPPHLSSSSFTTLPSLQRAVDVHRSPPRLGNPNTHPRLHHSQPHPHLPPVQLPGPGSSSSRLPSLPTKSFSAASPPSYSIPLPAPSSTGHSTIPPMNRFTPPPHLPPISLANGADDHMKAPPLSVGGRLGESI